jgi:hypothetical protein
MQVRERINTEKKKNPAKKVSERQKTYASISRNFPDTDLSPLLRVNENIF